MLYKECISQLFPKKNRKNKVKERDIKIDI